MAGAAALALVLAFAPRPAAAACDCSTIPTLGEALNYPAMSLFKDINISGSVWADNGNVGLGNDQNNNGKVSVSGSETVIDHIYYDNGTSVDISDGDVGGTTQQDMSQPIQDLQDASNAFKNMTPTQTFTKIESSRTITGNGCINVIKVNEGINMSGTLTFTGGFDDYFIVNVGKGVSFSGSGKIVLNGVEPNHVIFNLHGGGDDVSLSGSAAVYGTFVNPAKSINVSGDADNRGAYYAGETLSLSGSATWYGQPFTCDAPSSCPDPELTGANIQTPATPPSRASGNAPYYYAYYDTTTFEGHIESFRVRPDGEIYDNDSPPKDAVDASTNIPVSTRVPFWDAGVLLRTQTNRNLYTTKGGSPCSSEPTDPCRVDFTTSNITTTDLDVTDGETPAYPNYPGSGVNDATKLKNAVVNYLDGQDAFNEDNDGSFTEMRPTGVLGDPFRANQLFIGSPTKLLLSEEGFEDFHSEFDQRKRVMYAGANDGILHAFDAGTYWDQQDPTAFNAGTGAELFGYIPGALLSMIKHVPIRVDANGDRLVAGFLDGNSVAADAWLGTSLPKSKDDWATVLITAFRDGGNGYLALDITDPDASNGDPHYPYPKFLWEFTHTNLGKTWSKPVITRVKLKASSGFGDKCHNDDGEGDCREQWVAIFGGGIEETGDPNEDDYIANPSNAAWSDVSKAIFMVALDTGELISSVEFNASDTTLDDMKYSIASAPAVLDLNSDGFADVVYIGDLGGQLWKWDISTVGTDSNDADTLIDNWKYGIIFKTDRVDVGSSVYHYKSMYYPPVAAFVNNVLNVGFGTGNRRDTQYGGTAGKDDENRFYLIEDLKPIGSNAFDVTIGESMMDDATSLNTYTDTGSCPDGAPCLGYYIKGDESEKFITDPVIFAGHVLFASYKPAAFPTCGPGEAIFYGFQLSNARGFFGTTSTAADRSFVAGSGIPSSPRVSMSSDPSDDVIYVTTSEKEIITIEPPTRDTTQSDMLYWKHVP
jgi:type IV pilus assembly protein PilY1